MKILFKYFTVNSPKKLLFQKKYCYNCTIALLIFIDVYYKFSNDQPLAIIIII